MGGEGGSLAVGTHLQRGSAPPPPTPPPPTHPPPPGMTRPEGTRLMWFSLTYTPYEGVTLANRNGRKLGGIWQEVGEKPGEKKRSSFYWYFDQ